MLKGIIWLLQYCCQLCLWYSSSWFGKWRDMILLFNDFWWKIGTCFFGHLGILWEVKCLQFEIDQFFVLFVKFCIISVLYFVKSVKYGLDCDAKEILSIKSWRWGTNGGGFSRDSDILSWSRSCVSGGMTYCGIKFFGYCRFLWNW